MSLNTHKTKLCKRLSAIGIKQALVHSLIDQTLKWSHESGTDWTIQRLKGLKVGLLQHLAGNEGLWPSYVALNSKGTPKGPYGRLISDALNNSTDPKKVQRAISAIMVYSDFVAKEVTPKQWYKFQRSVEKPISSNTEKSFLSVMMDTITKFSNESSRKFNSSKHFDFMNWNSNQTREPIFNDLINGKAKTQPENPRELWEGFRHPIIRDYFKDNLMMTPFQQPIEGSPTMDLFSLAYMRDSGIITDPAAPSDTPVGKISFIQEPGHKLRAIANPHRVFQFTLDPLKKALLKVLDKKLVSDCTHDQNKGVMWAQEQLKAGESLSSVDLSDATNNFPLEIQVSLMKHLYPNNVEDIELFQRVSQANWLVYDPIQKKERTMKWSVGQPLGLGPSFPAFAMAHHAITWGAIATSNGSSFQEGIRDFLNHLGCKQDLDVRKYTNEYRIVGDDIVMKSKHEHVYKETLKFFDMAVSDDKTITSPILAEFASKVVTPNAIYVQNKWKSPSDRNFLDLMKNLGPTAIGLLKPRQIEVVKLIAQLPEWEGGLGWNPKGIPAHIRLAAYKDFINRDIDESQSHLQLEDLALAKAKKAFGDDFVYKINLQDMVRNKHDLDRAKVVSDRKPEFSASIIDRSMSITSRKYEPTEVPMFAEDVRDPLVRESGDPRPKSTLELFERRSTQDILKRANVQLTQVNALFSDKLNRDYFEQIVEDRIRNHRSLDSTDIDEIIQKTKAESDYRKLHANDAQPSDIDFQSR